MASRSEIVPRFYLYGEPHRAVDGRFVHVEALDDRSRPSEWTIQPHAHSDLNHIFHIRTGGGAMRAEQQTLAFEAPALLLVPAGVAHGFSWMCDSAGSVITASSAYLQHLQGCDRSLATLFAAPRACALEAASSLSFADASNDLMTELGLSALGHGAAAESGFLRILVLTLRAVGGAPVGTAGAARGDAALVARLRERIETRFRLREPIGAYAAALKSSQTRLRAACAAVAGCAPTQMLDQRAILEAQRALLYTSLSVGEIGANLGFDDPAYFSRFFARRVGAPPLTFRRTGGMAPA